MRYLIVVLALFVSAEAWAGCKGSIEGRWMLTGHTIPTMGTVRISKGKVLPESHPRRMIWSEGFGVQPTKQGRMSVYSPLSDNKFKSNRCLAKGTIRLEGGNTIEIWQVVVSGNSMTGIGYVNGQATAITMSRY